MTLFTFLYAASSFLHLMSVVQTHVTPSLENDNSTLITAMGFDGGGLFLKDFECPSTYLCPNPLLTKSKVLPKWDELNCQCDDSCATYGDCCINAKYYSAQKTISSRNSWKCLNFVEYRGLYMQTSCPSSWPAGEIREKCESGGVLDVGHRPAEDPLSMTPVTSIASRYTYQNFYCAYCSGDVENVIYWIPRIECDDHLLYYNATVDDVTEEFVWSNLEFNSEIGEWGIFISNQSRIKMNSLLEKPEFRSEHLDDPSSSNFIACRAMVQMPQTVADLVRQCKPSIDDCPDGKWEDETVRNLCHSYTASVFGPPTSGGIYKNVHCAICHGAQLPTLGCRADLHFRNLHQWNFVPSFAYLFDINESTGEKIGGIQRCTSSGEIFDPFFKLCRQMITVDETEHSDCPRFNISWLHYQIFSNGSIYIKEYEKFYEPHEYILASDGHILICMPLDADDVDNFYKKKFSFVLAYLTVTCLGISLLCLAFHLLAFTLVPSLRNLQGKDLVSLCSALIVAYITFIISKFRDLFSDEMCVVVGVLLYYSFVASFFWMNTIAFDVWRTLCQATSELRVSSGQQWKKFIFYSAYSWLGSAAVVASAIIVENSSYIPEIYKPSFGLTHCWFSNRRALLIFFVIPVIVLVIINVLLFSMSANIIATTTRNSAILHPNSKARRNFQIYLRLALVMGLTWISGIVAGLADWEPLWYVFVILNALQGLFIFLSFTCTRKVRNHLINKLCCSRNRGLYFSSAKGDKSLKKFNLEVRNSGSGESQSSQTSHLTLGKTLSNISGISTESLY
ncbi:hypothetical protein CHUAL_003264 [Chamberlinius hualienensis]